MQRLVGYLFFFFIAAAALLSLCDRLGRASTLNPFGEKPDWVGIILILGALGGGAALVVGKNPRSRSRDGKRDDDES